MVAYLSPAGKAVRTVALEAAAVTLVLASLLDRLAFVVRWRVGVRGAAYGPPRVLRFDVVHAALGES